MQTNGKYCFPAINWKTGKCSTPKNAKKMDIDTLFIIDKVKITDGMLDNFAHVYEHYEKY